MWGKANFNNACADLIRLKFKCLRMKILKGEDVEIEVEEVTEPLDKMNIKYNVAEKVEDIDNRTMNEVDDGID